jgi:hypothetical protein
MNAINANQILSFRFPGGLLGFDQRDDGLAGALVRLPAERWTGANCCSTVDGKPGHGVARPHTRKSNKSFPDHMQI